MSVEAYDTSAFGTLVGCLVKFACNMIQHAAVTTSSAPSSGLTLWILL
jgi:hypothetical protein